MMMAQQSKLDLLEGYRYDNVDGRYEVYIKWLDNSTLHIYHTVNGFGGPNYCGKAFIGGNASSSSYYYVFPSTPMSTLELGKTYKLTLTVIEVTTNTATAENDGTIILGIGKLNNYSIRGEIKNSDLKVGSKFEATNTYVNSYDCITGAAFDFSNPALKWDFKCKVDFEEVK